MPAPTRGKTLGWINIKNANKYKRSRKNIFGLLFFSLYDYLAKQMQTKILKTMAGTEILKHNGKSIFYMNFTNVSSIEEIKSIIDQSIKFIRIQPQKSVIALTNLENIFFNSHVKDLFLDFVKHNEPYIKTSAVIGMSGLVRIMFNGVMKLSGRDVRSHETMNKALDFLTHN